MRKKENLTSPLMASSVSGIWGLTQSIPRVFSPTGHEFTIFPNAVGEAVSTGMNTMSQVSSFEVNSDKDDIKKSGAPNLNSLEVTVLKHHTLHNTISEFSISQIAKGETASSQITLTSLNTTQVDVPPFGNFVVDANGIKLDSMQGSSTQINLSPIESRKIPLTSLVSSQKLFSSHKLLLHLRHLSIL